MDRLNLYETILGGSVKAAELFDPEEFLRLRSKPIIEVAYDYAREGNANAVQFLFSYYHNELKHKQIDVLNNFPETVDPDKYAKLLPKIHNDSVQIFDDPEDLRDEKDWIEYDKFEFIRNEYRKPINDAKQSEPTYDPEFVQNWYYQRTIEIESLTGLVDNALNFAEIAVVNGCKNMSALVENLKSLYTLVYDCKESDKFYTLDYISKLNDLEKLNLIMDNSYEPSNDMYIKSIQEWLLPFISRKATLEQRESLLKNYLIKISVNDLNACTKFLKLKQTSNNYLLQEINLFSIVIDCIYANEKPDQLDICNRLVSEITKPNEMTKKPVILSVTQQQQIETLKTHLKACELFKKYGIFKPVSYIRESCSSKEKCLEALRKLARFASKRSSHVNQSEWINLMKDLATLQGSLYNKFITYQDCNEMFIESLLSSKSLENIKFSMSYLKEIYAENKELAIQIVIKCEQDYFNGASNYLDPDIYFAKECLDLVKFLATSEANQKSEDPIVQKCFQMVAYEYDLIESLKFIAEFNYNILPTQVRTSMNRFEIINDIVKKNPNAYKDYEKLIKMGTLLHIEQPEQVKLLIANVSIKKKDLPITIKMCNQMMKANYSPAWTCVHELAINLCHNLVDNFKLFKISPTDLEPKLLFETLSNYDFKVENSLISSLTKEKLLKELKEIDKLLPFAIAHCDAKFILEILNQKQCIEKTCLNLEKLLISLDQEHEKSGEDSEAIEIRFDHLTDQFKSLGNEYYNTETFARHNKTLKILLNALLEAKRERFAKLSHSALNQIIKMLNQLNKFDSNLTFAYLLELHDENLLKLSEYFRFNSATSYQLCLYLLSIKLIQALMIKEIKSKGLSYEYVSSVYLAQPSTLISLVEEIVSNKEAHRDEYKSIEGMISFKLYEKFNRLYTNFTLNNQLEHLNLGIDLSRFAEDEVYKNDTILGLSMDLKTFELACSLARFYEFDIWKVYMSFTELLLTENTELTNEEIRQRLDPLLPMLKSRTDDYHSNMNTKVYSFIEGTDLDKLIMFYELLGNEKSDNHARIIKRLKTASLDSLNYKNLLERPLDTIESYLSESNLQFFAKLLPKLPTETKLTSSKVHTLWCLKMFWLQIDELMTNNVTSEKFDWSQNKVNQFFDHLDNLSESIKKLDLNTDLIYFVRELTLSKKSCQKLNLKIRKELTRRIAKLIKQHLNKTQIGEDKQELINAEFNQIQNHLKLMENVQSSLNKFGKEKREKNELVLNEIDESLGQIFNVVNENRHQIIENQLVKMILNGFSFELVNDLVKILETNRISVKHLVELSFNQVCYESTLNEEKIESKQIVDRLHVLFKSIKDYFDKQESNANGSSKESIISENDIMDFMRTICNDQNVDIKIRLFILEELKQNIKNIQESDLMLLLVYKTNAILNTCNCFNKQINLIESNDIDSSDKRFDLITKLIKLAGTNKDCLALINLLKTWPEFHSLPVDKKPWNQVLLKVIEKDMSFVELVKEIKVNKRLDEADLSFLIEQLKNEENWATKFMIPHLKLGVIFKQFEFIGEINSYLEKKINEKEGNRHILCDLLEKDSELMKLLIEDEIYIRLLNTPIYRFFKNYLLKYEPNEVVEAVIRNLKENQYQIEAASLLVDAKGFHQQYRTLSVSMALLKKFT